MTKIFAPHSWFLYKKAALSLFRNCLTVTIVIVNTETVFYTRLFCRYQCTCMQGRQDYLKTVQNIPAPHALWPELKPYVDVTSPKLTYIDCSRNVTLNLTQYLCLNFIMYLVYNSYVLHRVVSVDSCQFFDQAVSSWPIFSTFSSLWKEASLRNYIQFLNDRIKDGVVSLNFQDLCCDENHTIFPSHRSSTYYSSSNELPWHSK